jgi:hypothetical protein
LAYNHLNLRSTSVLNIQNNEHSKNHPISNNLSHFSSTFLFSILSKRVAI